MKKISKACIAFGIIRTENNADITNHEYIPDFDMLLFENQDVYLFDRKHGIEKLDGPSSCPNLGWAILQCSNKMENTRFSCLAIHDKRTNVIDVYKTSMHSVKFWLDEKSLEGFYEEVDRESHITSFYGLSASL